MVPGKYDRKGREKKDENNKWDKCDCGIPVKMIGFGEIPVLGTNVKVSWGDVGDECGSESWGDSCAPRFNDRNQNGGAGLLLGFRF